MQKVSIKQQRLQKSLAPGSEDASTSASSACRLLVPSPFPVSISILFSFSVLSEKRHLLVNARLNY